MKKILQGILAGVIIVVAVVICIPFLLMQFKIGIGGLTVDFYDCPLEDKSYIKKSGDSIEMVTLTTDGSLIVDQVVSDKEMMLHTVYKIDGSEYPTHIFGKYYLFGKTFFSLRKTKLDTRPLKAHSIVMDYQLYNCSSKSPKKIGETHDDIIYISDNYVILGGDTYERVNSIPKEISNLKVKANLK